ncbi:MAG TPA: ABC transporter ATP-binding protein [Candidatus Limnocylindria bacterium]|nr:ABC transporter ATP-binding protein [Candidatus Limnocylindria bacterium]
MDAIWANGVSKRYRTGTLALDGVSFAIPEGTRACLLGPNGAGKSTLIRLLEGALRPTAGEVFLLGERADDPGYTAARRRTGIVPQGPGMYRDVTAREHLELARTLYGRGDVDATLDAFGLREHADKVLEALSGGFRRRLVLATALLAEPDVLLLDEPTVGLDPVAQHDVRALLRTAMAGRTALLCTHDLREAEELSEDVVILRGGRVLVHEPLATLRARARPRIRLAAADGERLAGALRARGLEPAADGDGLLVPGDAQRDAPALLRALLAGGVDVYECRPVAPTLEQLFLEAVRA